VHVESLELLFLPLPLFLLLRLPKLLLFLFSLLFPLLHLLDLLLALLLPLLLLLLPLLLLFLPFHHLDLYRLLPLDISDQLLLTLIGQEFSVELLSELVLLLSDLFDISS